MSGRELADAAREAGCRFYDMPYEINYDHVDPLMRPIVRKINKTGWVFTAESCQGHPDADWGGPWQASTKPMLRIVTVDTMVGNVFKALFYAYNKAYGTCHAKPDPSGEGSMMLPPDPTGIEIRPMRLRGDEFEEFLIYLPAANVFQRNNGIQLFTIFSEAL